MIYTFVFLGEFGFELLNWQGTIRKFAAVTSLDDKIVCCSRAKLYPLYEMADLFIDISEVKLFKQSVASMYSACMFSDVAQVDFEQAIRRDVKSWAFERRLKFQIKKFVIRQLRSKNLIADETDCTIIFSDDGLWRNGCKFGAFQPPKGLLNTIIFDTSDRLRLAFPELMHNYDRLKQFLSRPSETQPNGEIYDQLDLSNNIYKCIKPDLNYRIKVEEKLGWSLATPFILCQTRRRDYAQPSEDKLPWRQIKWLLQILAKEIKVVLLTFDTGRYCDSYSTFGEDTNCMHYHCTGFPEQACLTYFSRHCLFFTEGDFGSHIYVPAFIGKDVTAIAPRSIFQLESAPVEFWNQKVFQFGGQIIPQIAEEIFETDSKIFTIKEEIFTRASV